MNVLFIGSRYINSVSMRLSPLIPNMIKGKTGMVDSITLAQEYYRRGFVTIEQFETKDYSIPISLMFKLLPEQFRIFDTVFVEQHGYHFHNDTDKKVIYYHRDIPTELFMEDMDILLYRFKKMEETIANEHPEVWNNGIHKERFLNGVEPSGFNPNQKKTFKGINWIGWIHSFEFYWRLPNQQEYYQHVKDIVFYAREQKCITYHEHGLNYLGYRDILEKSEAVLIIPGNEAYVTRKIYEAACCKTLIVLWVQNEIAEQTYKELGLISGVNCLMFHKQEELIKLAKLFEMATFEGIVNSAYDWVLENHTWTHRANEFLKILKRLKI